MIRTKHPIIVLKSKFELYPNPYKPPCRIKEMMAMAINT